MNISARTIESIDTYVQAARDDPELELEAVFSRKLDRETWFVVFDHMRRSARFEAVADATRDTLDVALSESNSRITVQGEFDIREYCTNNLVPAGAGVMLKSRIKGYPKLVLDEYDLAVRLSRERVVHDQERAEVVRAHSVDRKRFRRKMRHSFRCSAHPMFRIDATVVRQSERACRSMTESGIHRTSERYELEVEYDRAFDTDRARTARALSTDMLKLLSELLMIMHDTDNTLARSKSVDVVRSYLSLVNPSLENKRNFEEYVSTEMDRSPKSLFLSYQPVTLERDNLREARLDRTSVLEGYTVTEKADGERFLLFVDKDARVYLINNRMHVRSLGVAATGMEMTLLDGEFVKRDKFGNVLNEYLAFDAYFVEGKDVRGDPLVPDRYEAMRRATRAVGEGRTRVLVKKFLHGEPLATMAKRAYQDASYKYHIDGLILTPIDLAVGAVYKNRKHQKNSFGGTWKKTFKWKPPAENSIDFLVEHDGRPTNTEEEGSVVVARLCVAHRQSTDEFIDPVAVLHGTYQQNDAVVSRRFAVAYLRLEGDREVPQCTNGDPVYNRSVVEFLYDPSRAAHEEGRWVPHRVRRDKTELYKRTGNIFGAANSHVVAQNVWRSIRFPVEIDHLTGRSPVPPQDPEEVEDAYYIRDVDRNLSLIRPMNHFHNMGVKARLFRELRRVGGPRLLELACGKAGDLRKWVDARFTHVVGVDSVADNLLNSTDGAYKRYHQFQRDTPVHSGSSPQMLFLQKDVTTPWSNAMAETTHPAMRQLYEVAFGKVNAKDIRQPATRPFHNVLNRPFDVVSCQFAIHYFCASKDDMDTFAANVAAALRPGGIFAGTCMDGARVRALLERRNGDAVGRVDDNMVWAIRNLEPSDTRDGFGDRIQVYVESINRLRAEYLVDMNAVEAALANHGLVPVQTGTIQLEDTFEAIHEQDHYPMHDTLKTFSFLNRWFAFRKRETTAR